METSCLMFVGPDKLLQVSVSWEKGWSGGWELKEKRFLEFKCKLQP